MSDLARIRRILVAVDASRQSLAALDAAAQLAEALEAELLGVFVEDVNLLRLASLPFACEVGYATARARPLAAAEMEQRLRAQAARAQRAMAGAVARRRGISWSFRVTRGQVAASLLEVTGEGDLLAMGLTHIPLTAGKRLGSTVRAVLASALRPLLLSTASARFAPPFTVVADGSPAARRALAIARDLAAAEGADRLAVVLAGDSDSGALRAGVQQQLEGSGIEADFHHPQSANPADLARTLRQSARGSVILPAGTLLLAEGVFERLLPALPHAVLVVP